MKLFKKIIIITFLLIIYAYVCNISLLPSNYIINFKYTRTGKNK